MYFTEAARSFFHLFFPHCCAGCGSDLISQGQLLCLPCLSRLPVTNFHLHADNPVQQLFRGRLPVRYAASYLYFTKDSLLQQLVHQFKYKRRKDIGTWFGKRMGEALKSAVNFPRPDALVPVPLHKTRERNRGYNQAAVLCEGMASVLDLPVWRHHLLRSSDTHTQTHMNRIERWQNMAGKFQVKDAPALQGRNLLLVDDIITTGATLEACGQALLAAAPVQLSIATLGFAFR